MKHMGCFICYEDKLLLSAVAPVWRAPSALTSLILIALVNAPVVLFSQHNVVFRLGPQPAWSV
jgi:hypothetical protein